MEIGGVVNNHLVDYPMPGSINYLWGLGSMSGIMLVVQISTGVFLAMHYKVGVGTAWASVEHIMRDVNGGWILRYVHANGASMFFIVVYIHIARGLYHGSYERPREGLWWIGIGIFLLMIITAFIGYVLPWGQMSFWGATVITSMVEVIPGVGGEILGWLWGGYGVSEPTLGRFYALHYLLPFVIAALALVHIIVLHIDGSTNPVGGKGDKITFYPYAYVKDLTVWMGIVIGMTMIVIYEPNMLGHPVNYEEASEIVTPEHIVPEWYFLPFYAILRSVESKLGGVILMVGAIVILGVLPGRGEVRTSRYRPMMEGAYWNLIGTVIMLGWLGGKVAEEPYVTVSRIMTVNYFITMIGIMSMGGLEKRIMRR